MDLNIKLPTPDEINRQITEAVAKSAVGAELDKAVRREVDRLSATYNNPLDKVVQQEVGRLLVELVREEYGPVIREKVRALLSEKVTDDFVGELWRKWFAENL